MKRNRSPFLVAGVCAVAILVLLAEIAVRRADALPDDTYKELATFANVLAIVQKNYVEPVTTKELRHGYDYVRVSSFEEGTGDDLQKTLDKFRASHNGQVKGLVLDLRDNPGGLLNQAVQVGDEFLDGGLIVYTQGRQENQQ